eukprot:CAMPEP_0194259932 /NCGR_PEP_ID=MMETSP0158-20130606/44770_1 /TAXON_ID=33649 /ORGANISM="Thalassionema nitzschioides, Strain L26-B" /LENGTH=921 /DNA_ID=CAMNT_0038999929 /DNA_START=126 /DNA_END=2891 /DNA_ORIENTATION=-
MSENPPVGDETTPLTRNFDVAAPPSSAASTASAFPDEPSERTYGRRIAQTLSSNGFCGAVLYGVTKTRNKTIFIPGKHDEEEGGEAESNIAIVEPPSLDKGWYFFEHIILPRCYANQEEFKRGRKYARSPPGESTEKTRLYPIWDTPLEDMADFGIGVGMYFHMVRFFGVVALLAAFISTPSINFYRNDYSPGGRDSIMNPLNSNSAICTTTSWKACPNCSISDLDTWPTKVDDPERIIEGVSSDGISKLVFIAKNECQINETFAMANIKTMFFYCAATLLFIFLQRRVRTRLDEGEQTTSDYSIRVKNPPRNAKDPKAWKDFFEGAFENVHVTLCTVAIDNEELIRKLVKRRKLLLKLRNKIPAHIKFKTEDLETMIRHCIKSANRNKFICFSNPKNIYDKVKKIDREIEACVGQDFPVSSVYITLETEEMQRKVLSEMIYPTFNPGIIDRKFTFKGNALKIDEPDEPSAVRWLDLEESNKVRIIQRICTYSATFAILLVNGVIITMAREVNVTMSALTIIAFNILSPPLVKFITKFESHVNETSYSTSNYIKLTLLRWFNTAIITAIIAPFMYTAQDGKYLIEGTRILFTAELIQRPLIQLTDWQGHLKRHVLAPRAKDQRRMNDLFSAKEYSVGERYTDVTKLLFLTCFYSIVYPKAWYFTAAILFVYYWVDKFSVLRSWRQGSKISGELSVYSVYYLLLCLATYFVMGAYYFAGFPFDNACETGETVPAYYEGSHDFGDGVNFIISAGDKVYKFCSQSLVVEPNSFPPFLSNVPNGKEWMSVSQLQFLPIYARSCVAISVLVSAIIAFRLLNRYIVPLFSKVIKTQGKVMGCSFSEVDDIKAYIPQVDIKGYELPYVMCNTSNIDPDLIGWRVNIIGNPGDFNLIDDLPIVLKATKSKKFLIDDVPAFSQVMHWPPS